MRIREIQEKDNNSLFLLIRKSLEDAELNIPGTAYFDESIKAMSEYYKGYPKRKYFVVVDENDEVLGGAGFAEFNNNDSVAELQKLYIFEHARGKGLGCKLVKIVEEEAEVVRKIFTWFSEGDGTHRIARKLEAEGTPTFRYSNGWSNTVILRILRNEK